MSACACGGCTGFDPTETTDLTLVRVYALINEWFSPSTLCRPRHPRKRLAALARLVAATSVVVCVAHSAPAPAATPLDVPTEPGAAQRQRASDRASGVRDLSLNGNPLGQIMVHLAPNGEPWVPKAALIDMLTPMLDDDRALLGHVRSVRDQGGNIRLRSLAAFGFSFALDRPHLRLTRVPPASPKSSETKPGAPARRSSVIEFQVTSGNKKVGDITGEVFSGSDVRLPKAPLIDMLTPLLDGDPAAVARLEGLPEKDGQLTLEALGAAGFSIKAKGSKLDITRELGFPSAARPPIAMPKAATAKPPAIAIGPDGLLVPLVQDGEVLGEVLLRANADNQILLPKSILIDMLTPVLEKDQAALGRLTSLPDQNDQVALDALKKAGIALSFVGNRVELGTTGDQPAGYGRAVSARLNPTARAITVNVPFKEGQSQLGEIMVRIDPDGTIAVPKAALVQLLGRAVDKAVLAQIEKLPEKNGLVALGALGGADFRLAYDPNQMELAFFPAIEQRARNDLSLAQAGRTGSANVVAPATFAGFVNITGGADYRWEGTGMVGLYLGLQSAVRMAGVVLENDFTYESAVDPVQCPFIAVCVYEHKAGFKRRASRLVYDLPDQQMRLNIGDVDQPAGAFQRSNEVLGVSLEMSPRKLTPGQSLRPTSGSAIAIERPSDVEIIVNGAISQRLRLNPGNYNIRDLPLTAGANDVELVVTDDRGQRRTFTFNMFSDAKMLAAGKSEWAVSGGVGSYLADGERTYRPDDVLAGGFYRLGLTDTLSFEAQAKGDVHIVEGGFGLLAGTKWGALGIQSAVSSSETGIGIATNVNWDLINFRGLLGSLNSTRESMRLSAEYRSAHFRTPGEYVVTSTGILYPQTPYWLRLVGAYSIPITMGTTASVSARYQFADPDQVSVSPYRIDGDRYGIDATLSSSLGRMLSTSLTAGYSNEITQRAVANLQGDVVPDWRVMLRFYLRPADNTRISGSYDTLNGAANVSAYQGASSGSDRWEADINVQTDGNAQQQLANGSLAWSGNRGEMRLSQVSSVDSLAGGQTGGNAVDRSSMRFATAIAFADGRAAIGAPVRGNGFAIVYPHASLAGKEMAVGDANTPRAKANWLGPALVPDLPAYAQNSIPVNVADLPPGYSLGSGAFDVFAPYRGGYALQVGSANSVSAFGILVSNELTPLALTTGEARPVEGSAQGAKTVSVFTNQAGRFVAEGLAPGKWSIEMATEPTPTRYVFEIAKTAEGVVQVGRLTPAKE